jgi:hypothetical protein
MKRVMFIILVLFMASSAFGAEILVKAVDVTHPDSVKDRRGSYKRGMPVVVMPDGHQWGTKEGPPLFVVIKIPGVPVAKIRKYIEPELSGRAVYRRRLWHISWADLPQGAKDKLLADGELTIKAGAYDGPYDYTWAQVRSYFKQITSGQAETGDLD